MIFYDNIDKTKYRQEAKKMKKQLTQLLLVITLIIALPFLSAKQTFAATNDEVSKFVQQFVGVPYQWGGTTIFGFDCSGLIRHAYSNFGIELPRTSEDQFKVGKAVAEGDLQPGDIVFFKNTYKVGISHSGIYLGDNTFISAETNGVAIAKLKSHPYWEQRYAGARRVVESANSPIAFSDLPKSHPAYNAIQDLAGKGVINGYLDATFRAEDSVTRGQAAAMVNRVLKLTAKEPVIFSDVGATHQFAADIAAMNEIGILKGYETGAFGIKDHLTRGQLAIIVDRAFQLQEKAKQKVQIASLYADVPANYWASASIHALKVLDQTTLFQTPTYDINKVASRAEFSAAVFSAIKAQ